MEKVSPKWIKMRKHSCTVVRQGPIIVMLSDTARRSAALGAVLALRDWNFGAGANTIPDDPGALQQRLT